LPVNVALNKYGNIVGRKGGKLKKLIARPDTFVGTVKGVYGIWQRGVRSKAGKFRGAGDKRATAIKLLVRFHQAVDYSKRFDFYGTAERTFYKHFDKQFTLAFDEAMRTAR
jgi:hypothetical protein